MLSDGAMGRFDNLVETSWRQRRPTSIRIGLPRPRRLWTGWATGRRRPVTEWCADALDRFSDAGRRDQKCPDDERRGHAGHLDGEEIVRHALDEKPEYPQSSSHRQIAGTIE